MRKYNLVIGDPQNAIQYSTKRKVEQEFGRTVRYFKKLGYTILNKRIGFVIALSPCLMEIEIYINRNF